MDPIDVRTRVAEWLTEHQDGRKQDDFAADIRDATGWDIERTRLGRYKKGSLPVGREVLEHFADYAAKRDLPPIDLGPREAPPSFEERAARAAERQADALEAILALLSERLTGADPAILRAEADVRDALASLPQAPSGMPRPMPTSPSGQGAGQR